MDTFQYLAGKLYYVSNFNCFLLLHIIDFIGLSPDPILLLLQQGSPEQSAKDSHHDSNSTLGTQRSNIMKNIVRAFVVVLALTGAVAATQTSASASPRSIAASSMQSSLMPVPTCPPDGTTDCGITASKGK
jgi:hypothetical protein